MFRKTVNGDISDEDFKKILIPFNDNYNEFLAIYKYCTNQSVDTSVLNNIYNNYLKNEKPKYYVMQERSLPNITSDEKKNNNKTEEVTNKRN